MKPAHSVRELARRLKLSPATVSLALRGNASVAPATRARVLAGAAEHGYRPDPAMSRALFREKGRVQSIRRTVQIAHIRSTHDNPLSEGPHWALPLQGLSEQAARRGFLVEDFNLRHYANSKSLCRVLYNRGFEGVVLGTFLEPRIIQAEDLAPFAVVELGRCDVQPRVLSVRRDESAAVRLSWEKIRAAGYQRPGFCLMHHDPMLEDDKDRLGAWWFEAKGPKEMDPIPPYRAKIIDPQPNEFLKWYQRHRPDVIVGFNSGTRWMLSDQGIHPGRDCGYMQLHVSPTEIDVPGVLVDLKSYGTRCVAIIENLLNYGKLGVLSDVEDVVLQPKWIDA